MTSEIDLLRTRAQEQLNAGHYESALVTFRRVRSLAASIDDEWNIANADLQEGTCLLSLGRYAGSASAYQRAATSFHAQGNTEAADISELYYGVALQSLEKHTEASEIFTRLLTSSSLNEPRIAEVTHRLGENAHAQGVHLTARGAHLTAQGFYRTAHGHFQAAKSRYARLGREKDVADAEYWIGRTMESRGASDSAVNNYVSAGEKYESIHLPELAKKSYLRAVATFDELAITDPANARHHAKGAFESHWLAGAAVQKTNINAARVEYMNAATYTLKYNWADAFTSAINCAAGGTSIELVIREANLRANAAVSFDGNHQRAAEIANTAILRVAREHRIEANSTSALAPFTEEDYASLLGWRLAERKRTETLKLADGRRSLAILLRLRVIHQQDGHTEQSEHTLSLIKWLFAMMYNFTQSGAALKITKDKLVDELKDELQNEIQDAIIDALPDSIEDAAQAAVDSYGVASGIVRSLLP